MIVPLALGLSRTLSVWVSIARTSMPAGVVLPVVDVPPPVVVGPPDVDPPVVVVVPPLVDEPPVDPPPVVVVEPPPPGRGAGWPVVVVVPPRPVVELLVLPPCAPGCASKGLVLDPLT